MTSTSLKKFVRRAVRLIAVIAVVTAMFTIPALAQTAGFRDVPPTHFAFDAINWVSDPANGFMVGDAGRNFHPSRTINKFDAAQIYALAAGFRHNTQALPPAERDMITRSFDRYRSFLDDMATEFSTWNRTADREIAFLLYRGIVTTEEVQGFVTRTGNTEQRPLLTRQQAVAWMVRLVGQAAHAQAVTLPHHTPFRDDALISSMYRRYVYHARELGIIQGAGGYVNPTGHFTRAEMATVFYNALATQIPTQAAAPTAPTPATVTGTIANVFLDTHVSITSAAGTETFPIAPNAVIIIDNTQRTPAFLREGMNVTVLVDANRRVISLVARAQAAAPVTTTPPAAPPGLALYSDEGFITAVSATPVQSVTIRTQRVRITGQILDEERTFTFAPNAQITRGGAAAAFADISVNDIAFFSSAQNVIHSLELMERERTILGILAEVRPPDNQGGSAVFIIEETDGMSYELRVTPATEFSRDSVQNLNWDNLRIGDAITAEVEFDRLVRVQAVGERSTVYGRLNEIRISERNTQITITTESGAVSSFFVRPGVFDVYTLRIGMNLRLSLDSREVISVQIQGGGQASATAILGFIQSIRPDGTLVISEGQGAAARTHTITVPPATTITSGGSTITAGNLRVNMNVYIVLTAPGSNAAQSITVLP